MLKRPRKQRTCGWQWSAHSSLQEPGIGWDLSETIRHEIQEYSRAALRRLDFSVAGGQCFFAGEDRQDRRGISAQRRFCQCRRPCQGRDRSRDGYHQQRASRSSAISRSPRTPASQVSAAPRSRWYSPTTRAARRPDRTRRLRLITEEKVVAITGAYQSGITLTASAIAEKYGIPFVNGESVAANLTERGFKWFFRVTPVAADFAKIFYRLPWRYEGSRCQDRQRCGRP